MNRLLSSIEKLGLQVEFEYRRANVDQRQLPKIAEAALTKFNQLDGVDLKALVSYLEDGSVPQQGHNPFSDLPVTVFRSRDFYIELLVWSHATTSIHQHGFSGAFRVVRGSSIHTRYAFRTRRRVSDDCLIGDMNLLGSETLSVGSVRRIEPGADGLIHSLYHLDNPSLSLIVRTTGHSAFGPQYSYYPPTLALYRKALESDDLVSTFSRLLLITQSTDRALFQSLWLDKISAMEFPRLAWLYLRHYTLLDNEEQAAFYQRAMTAHGGLVSHLFKAVERYTIKDMLVRLREQIHDAGLRFFLALLLNVPDRNDLLTMIARRHPERDPVECCADWLCQMSVNETSEFERMKEIARAMETTGGQKISFSRQLRRALPHKASQKDAREIFTQFVDSGTRTTAEQTAERENALSALAAMPQLASLRYPPDEIK